MTRAQKKGEVWIWTDLAARHHGAARCLFLSASTFGL